MSSEGTRQTTPFAECQVVALGKDLTPSAPLTGQHWAKGTVCRALGKGDSLPSAIRCRRPALGKARACRVADVCRVLVAWHSTNHIFTECPCSGTRQRPRHSANLGFPVVLPLICFQPVPVPQFRFLPPSSSRL